QGEDRPDLERLRVGELGIGAPVLADEQDRETAVAWIDYRGDQDGITGAPSVLGAFERFFARKTFWVRLERGNFVAEFVAVLVRHQSFPCGGLTPYHSSNPILM